MSKLAAAYESIDANHNTSGLQALDVGYVIAFMQFLDHASLLNLYLMWRLLGVRRVFLLQADADPGVGVWVPILPTIVVANVKTLAAMDDEVLRRRDLPFLDVDLEILADFEGEDLHEELRRRDVRGEGNDRIPPITMSTAALCDLIHRFHDMTPTDNHRKQSRRVQKTADRDGITHWQLVDLSLIHI